MHIDYRAELNPEQYEAVTAMDGPLLIIAGAGSGKTRVITYRMAWMLDQGLPQHAILGLTFTNKAAREMSERVRAITGKALRDLTVSTFHSFGVRILRKEIGLLGYRDNFSIYDEADRSQLVKDCARELGFRMESFDAWKVGALFSDIRSGTRPWCRADDAYRGLYDEYRRSLRVFNAVDFDDLIGLPIEIFELDAAARGRWRDRYRHVMIDEFQDTSIQQYRLMHLLADRDICVVGDDDQSIYSWRGANYENLRRFETDFPGFLEVRLERNYRSTTTILDAANAIIRNNGNRKDKALWSPSGEGGSPIEIHVLDDDAAEADFISQTIKEIRQGDRLSWEDFGILIRTNALARRLEESLLAANVPYRISGGDSFFARKEVKDLIAYLRVIANPDDDVNLVRIVNTPRRGIGKATIERLNAIARAGAMSLRAAMELARAAGPAAVPAAGGGPAAAGEGSAAGEGNVLSGKALEDIGTFLDLLDSHRDGLLGRKKIADKVRRLADDIDWWGYLVEENKHSDKAATWKVHNVETFIRMIDEWENDPDTHSPGLYEWLNRITLITRDDDRDDGGKVNLMTIHAAKGLEFDTVFIAGCEEGIIPHARSLEEGAGTLEEERRLFYVAVTRARRRLIITSAARRRRQNHLVEQRPSPFLEEIPAALRETGSGSSVLSEEEGEACFGKLLGMFGEGEAEKGEVPDRG